MHVLMWDHLYKLNRTMRMFGVSALVFSFVFCHNTFCNKTHAFEEIMTLPVAKAQIGRGIKAFVSKHWCVCVCVWVCVWRGCGGGSGLASISKQVFLIVKAAPRAKILGDSQDTVIFTVEFTYVRYGTTWSLTEIPLHFYWQRLVTLTSG